MKKNIQLLIIDPQNDFCDLPSDWLPTDAVTGQITAPALPVAGAHADMLRLAKLIQEGASGISAIGVTLDSHHRFDIAHPTFWKTGAGAAVGPFTNVHPAVKAAYNSWEDSRLAVVQKINKGSNPWTEHYSAMQAEVPDEEDPATQLNTALIASLDQADLLIIAGEASSHCVKATTEHIVENLPSGKTGKVVLLTDCMSPVGGFEAQHQAFLDDMASRGVVLSASVAMLGTLQTNA
ncbi:MAG: cysteine hydrolase [Polaromonas sp.]|nr:cysteine hydrolase [Polaromonas sp.]